MRHRRPDSNRESGVTANGVRISHSIGAARYPRTGVAFGTPRRGERAVLLTALALQRIHRIHRHEITIHKVLNDARTSRGRLGYAGTPVFVWALASSHSNTSALL